MNKSRLLSEKVCIITGSGKGIGKAIAERFAEEGAIVYANARQPESIDDWAKQCSVQNQTQIIPLYFDITDYVLVKQSIMQVMKAHQRIDVLVNNAGMITYEPLGMINPDTLRAMFETNVVAPMQLIQYVSRLMMRQNKGSIINISSIVGVTGAKGQLAYSATKGALNTLTKSAAKELAANNIRVNGIAPGMVDTDRFRMVFENNFKEKISNIGLGRLADPKEIADACVFLGSDLSQYISGQILGVDGCTIL